MKLYQIDVYIKYLIDQYTYQAREMKKQRMGYIKERNAHDVIEDIYGFSV